MEIVELSAYDAPQLLAYFLQDEASHVLQATIVNHLDRWEGSFVLVAREREKVLGTLIHSAFFLLDTPDETVARDLAHAAFQRRPQSNKIQGPVQGVRAFVDTWTSLSGRGASLEMHERIYQLTAVQHPQGILGQMRKSTPEDWPLLEQWARAFVQEAVHETLPDEDAQAVARRDNLFLWDLNGTPVSLAAASGKTPHGIRINFVYTPPEHRGKGYAAANVATLSQHLLDSGNQFCALFTDLDNPTSNKLYQRLGYCPVVDIDKYQLE